MQESIKQFWNANAATISNVTHIIDILLVSFIIYKILSIIKGTQGIRILAGIATFVLALYLSKWLGLNTLNWLLDKATLLGPVALVILLLPELRQALEGLGKLGLWPDRLVASDTHSATHTIEEVVAAVTDLAAERVGALIVFERTANLDDIIDKGIKLEAVVSAPVIASIFYGANPLHDGAAIVRGDRVVAAACRLPLSESSRLDSTAHMRHRAAVGVTESLDAFSVVVSEERGTISYAVNGHLKRVASPAELREAMIRELQAPEPEKLVSKVKSRKRRHAQ